MKYGVLNGTKGRCCYWAVPPEFKDQRNELEQFESNDVNAAYLTKQHLEINYCYEKPFEVIEVEAI